MSNLNFNLRNPILIAVTWSLFFSFTPIIHSAPITQNLTTPFSNGYELNEESCWTQFPPTNANSDWRIITESEAQYPNAIPHTGTQMAMYNSKLSLLNSQNIYYCNTPITLPITANAITLSYWMFHDTAYPEPLYPEYPDLIDAARISISTYTITWTPANAWQPRYAAFEDWNQINVDLNSYAGQTIYVGIEGLSGGGGNIYIDDVTVTIDTNTTEPSLGEALDNLDLSWSHAGSQPWYGQRIITHDGEDAAQSGAVADAQNSWFETDITGPGTLSFWWKVSSEADFDYLSLYLDNGIKDKISGEIDWTQKTLTIPTGEHTVSWGYEKNDAISTGTDAGWIDQITFHTNSYTVTPMVAAHGSVAPANPTIVADGDNLSLTVTPNTGYTTHPIVSGTCPQGSWNGNVWTTGTITADCTVNFNFVIANYTITASANPTAGGNVTPSFATTSHGNTQRFTITPNAGYIQNNLVTGTCPQGTWNGNVWTTGTITADCTVTFNFIKVYTITPSANPTAGGTVTPNSIQVVNHAATKTFTVMANTGYTRNNIVTGTCPQGTWNGNVWTTGAITANCTIIFNFTQRLPPIATTTAATTVSAFSATLNGTANGKGIATTVTFDFGPTTQYGQSIPATPNTVATMQAVAVKAIKNDLICNTSYHYRTKAVNSAGTHLGSDQTFTTATCPTNSAWLYPTNPSITIGRSLTLELRVNSNALTVGNYDFTMSFDKNKLTVNTAYQNNANTCENGICPGTTALSNNHNTVDNSNGIIRLTGSDVTGIGPGNNLQLLTINFLAKHITGTTQIGLILNELSTPLNNPIGIQATGNTITLLPGICGDVDDNEIVNIIDALSLARRLVNLPPPPTVNLVLADVNNTPNGLAIEDAMNIAKYSVGLTVTNTCLGHQRLTIE